MKSPATRCAVKVTTSMRGEIIVETQEEFDAWILSKTPKYFAAFPDKDPANQKVSADSTKPVAAATVAAAGSH